MVMGVAASPSIDKNMHIASAATYFNNHAITRASTLLIDDDFRNIEHALTHEIRALHFDPSDPARYNITDLTLHVTKDSHTM